MGIVEEMKRTLNGSDIKRTRKKPAICLLAKDVLRLVGRADYLEMKVFDVHLTDRARHILLADNVQCAGEARRAERMLARLENGERSFGTPANGAGGRI